MSVFVKDHALWYLPGSPQPRTGLTLEDITSVIENKAWVRVGFGSDAIEFHMAWDWKADKPIVLLTAPGWSKDEVALISIQEFWFDFPPKIRDNLNRLRPEARAALEKIGITPPESP